MSGVDLRAMESRYVATMSLSAWVGSVESSSGCVVLHEPVRMESRIALPSGVSVAIPEV